MDRPRFLGPCPTTWSFGGWRAWYDRILYGHVGHTCQLSEHITREHICKCGARLRTTPLATPTPHPEPQPDPDYEDPGIPERRPRW